MCFPLRKPDIDWHFAQASTDITLSNQYPFFHFLSTITFHQASFKEALKWRSHEEKFTVWNPVQMKQDQLMAPARYSDGQTPNNEIFVVEAAHDIHHSPLLLFLEVKTKTRQNRQRKDAYAVECRGNNHMLAVPFFFLFFQHFVFLKKKSTNSSARFPCCLHSLVLSGFNV